MSLADIRLAIADALKTIPKVRPVAYITDGAEVPSGGIYAELAMGEISYDIVMGRGADLYTFTVRCAVQRVDEIRGQALLDTLREPSGATSVKTVLEADETLGGLVDYVHVKAASADQVITVGQLTYLGVEFTVEVCV